MSSLTESTNLNTTQSILTSTIENFLPNMTEKLMLNETSIETTSYIKVNVALIIYGCLIVVCIITAVSKCLLFFKICMNASKNIHNKMFSSILKAPMRFFNKQTSGKINSVKTSITLDFKYSLNNNA